MPLTVLCCILASVHLAQVPVTRKAAHPKAVKDYEAGVQAAYNRDTRNAIRYFEAAIRREPNFVDALVELSGVHYNQGNYAPAEQVLERVAALDGDAGSRALYGLAMAELKQDKFEEAILHLDAYLQRPSLREDRRKTAERYRTEAGFKLEALRSPVALDLQRLPSTINSTRDAEYLPSLTADGNTLVFTRRVGNRQEDFFASERIDGQWQAALPLTGVNTLENEGAQTLSADGRLLIYTACNRPDGLGSCDLYYSVKEDGGWSEPANLGAPVNTKAWESQPALAANGNLLFFASRREGGQGKADLYACGRTPTGGWTEPMNLGPTVNTAEDDQAPFFHADGQTLYFMSNGHPGMGNFDLYLTRLGEDRTWTTPHNLGYPINTEGNEGALAVGLDGQTAYFATDAATPAGSDSVGVGGARSGTTDLFMFTLPAPARAGVVTYVRAQVIDDETEQPISALAMFSDAATNQPYLKRRAREQTGDFLAVLPAGKTYTLAVEHPGYLFYSDRFELTEPASASEPFELLIRLQAIAPDTMQTIEEEPSERKPIVLRNVLFASGSAELLDPSRNELDRLVGTLREHPDMRIRLQGHTDDVGSEEDNLALSTARAAAVKRYLVTAGIAADRLESTGFGESRPLLENTDEGSRALNRRTEFVVL